MEQILNLQLNYIDSIFSKEEKLFSFLKTIEKKETWLINNHSYSIDLLSIIISNWKRNDWLDKISFIIDFSCTLYMRQFIYLFKWIQHFQPFVSLTIFIYAINQHNFTNTLFLERLLLLENLNFLSNIYDIHELSIVRALLYK